MKKDYETYAESRLEGSFGEMSSWRFVYPYLQDKKVLDIGCSDGLYLSQFSSQSLGIEQVEVLSESAKAKGLNVINGDIKTLRTLNADEFEGVLFSHVMEHVDAPIASLREINRILKKNGTFVLGLPIERNIFRDLLRMDYFNGTHIYAFSIRNARKLLSETGFTIEKVYFHLPKCQGTIGRRIETIWNAIGLPFREYFSMAYWIVARKK